MTAEKLSTIITALKKLRETLSDTVALEYSVLYNSWAEDREFIAGDRINYNNKLYRVIQTHTSQPNLTPDETPTMFELIEVIK